MLRGVSTITSGVNGDVDGPTSSTDNAVARFDGTTGKLIQNSGVIIDDSNNVSSATITVSSSTPSANGLYLPAANTLGLTANSLPFLQGTTSASAVNWVTINGGASAGGVIWGSNGSDTDVSMNIRLKGAGNYSYQTTTGSMQKQRYTADANGGILNFDKSRNASVGNQTIIQNGDALGNVRFRGSDGANFVIAAQIQAAVDGAPGTNDMPGRLVFSTTVDGAAAVTEAMRIDSSQRLTTTSGRIQKTRVVTAAGAIAVAVTDYYIGVNKSVGAATVVNLPASPLTGTTFVIKDEKLDAATNNITITPAAGNIVGTARAATYVINTNGGGAMIVYNGTEWIVMSRIS